MSNNVILETKNISKTYVLGITNIEALKNVSITINKGEFISIIGKSGSGKSTLMHLIGLLDSPTSGHLYLNDRDVSKLSDASLAKTRNAEIGFVFQSFNLLQRTSALDNVMLPLRYSNVPSKKWKSRAEEMLDIVGLSDRKHNKSNELSGGQKQRVAIARALVNNPSLILADEPTGNLDTKTVEEIIALFRKLNKERKTIVLVTHDTDLANVTEKQIIIKDGKISETL